MAPSPDNQELASVFGFTAEQLVANREGRVADGQTAPLWTGVLWGVPLSLLALGLGLSAIKFAKGFMRVLGPILGAIVALVLAGVIAYPSLRDLFDPTVAVVEGPVTEQSGAGKGPGKAVLTIGDQRLLSEGETMAAAEAIVKNQVYRAYYLPNTKRLLSIEPAGAAPP